MQQIVSDTESVLGSAESAFKDFVHALEEGGYRHSVDYLLEGQSPEFIAYYRFYQAVRVSVSYVLTDRITITNTQDTRSFYPLARQRNSPYLIELLQT